MTTTSQQHVHPGRILAVLALSGFAFSVLSSAVTPALPEFQRTLHASRTDVAWLVTAFLLSSSVGTAIIGRLGDSYGKSRVLFLVLVALSFGSALAAIARSLEVLVVARVIQGSAGAVFPLSYGIVREQFPRDKVAGSIGLLSSILGVGGAFGAIAGALIVDHLGTHWLFWLPLTASVVAATCTRLYVPPSKVRQAGRINWLAAALMGSGICALLLGVSHTSTWGWGNDRTLLMLGLGVVLCVAWVLVETRSRVPLIDMHMMRMRGVWTTNLAGFVMGAGMYAALLVLPQFAQLPPAAGIGFGTTVVGAALLMIPSSAMMATLASQTGRIERRFGSQKPFILGALVAAGGFVFTIVAHAHPYQQLMTTAMLGTGMGLAFAALGNLIVQAVPPTQTGAASGMNAVTRTLGGAIAGQVAATFLASHVAHGYPTMAGFTSTYVLAAALLLLAAAAGLLIPREQPGRVGPGLPADLPPLTTAVASREADRRTLSGPVGRGGA